MGKTMEALRSTKPFSSPLHATAAQRRRKWLLRAAGVPVTTVRYDGITHDPILFQPGGSSGAVETRLATCTRQATREKVVGLWQSRRPPEGFDGWPPFLASEGASAAFSARVQILRRARGVRFGKITDA